MRTGGAETTGRRFSVYQVKLGRNASNNNHLVVIEAKRDVVTVS